MLSNKQFDNKQLWESALVDIEPNISKANFNTWFKNTHILKQEDGVVFLGVPNEFVREWLNNKYHSFILKALRETLDGVRGIEYVISKGGIDVKTGQNQVKNDAPVRQLNTLALEDLYIDRADNLNPRYTFDSFVIGQFNELAHAAAQAVIKKIGSVYNPLFIYGGTGLGKTHLIQAVGNHIKKNCGDKRVHYVTSEKFSLDYINSLQSGKINNFKEKYRSYDVLIMDDIQFLSNKEKTQEELFHLFNTLYDNNKQIVFSSDKHANYIPAIEDRLRSRFSAGMIVDVSEPEYESRVAILRSKMGIAGFSVSNDILEYLASSIDGNIRDLEGVLNLVVCQSQLKNRDLSVNEVKVLIKNNTKPKKFIASKDVVKIVADFYSIDPDFIYKKTRRKEVVRPRQVVMYILREDFSVSYPSIGHDLGGRDHTTVIHSCEKIKNDLKNNPVLSQEIERIRTLF